MNESKMFERVLIANRGEIALRILRTCHELGVETVAAYSKVDKDLLHLKYATDVVCISQDSYLDARSIVAAASNFACDAIHPGYGFLSENADFAQMVELEGIAFIGAKPESISSMGDKSNARKLAQSYGLNPVPGSEGVLENLTDARAAASQVGYPLMLKAAHGGGGRGIRIVLSSADFDEAFDEAQMEAESAFSSGGLYIEKFLDRARHIEVQIVGDGAGKAIHLGSRECSIQRKQQKLIEEAPATNVSGDLLQTICLKSSEMAAGLFYRGMGTMEFLYQDGKFYFIEMNTRIQVEHPVTESVTGIDLVRMQMEVAASGRLDLTQENVVIKGHSFECRINAEDADFNPSPGLLCNIRFPGGYGVRVDSHLYEGYTVPHQYDSLIAKLVTVGNSRHDALVRMRRALDEFSIQGIECNVGLHRKVCNHDSFITAAVDTNFLQREIM